MVFFLLYLTLYQLFIFFLHIQFSLILSFFKKEIIKHNFKGQCLLHRLLHTLKHCCYKLHTYCISLRDKIIILLKIFFFTRQISQMFLTFSFYSAVYVSSELFLILFLFCFHIILLGNLYSPHSSRACKKAML